MDVYHGGAREFQQHLLDYSYSANPYTPGFLKKAVRIAQFNRYPYCENRLEHRIKEKYNISDDVVIGAGITELLNMVSYVFKTHTAVMLKNTYGEYARVATLFNMSIRFVHALDPEPDMLTLGHNEILYFSNPNNPTGKYYRFLKDIAEEAVRKHSIVIADEAFIDFVKMPVLETTENMIVLRSFTKAYSIPGIRVGYAIAPDHIAKKLRSFRMPWSVGALGCAIVTQILEDDQYLHITKAKIFKERERIARALSLKTDANYFIADVQNGTVTKSILEKKGILVRDCTSFGLPCCIRFAIRNRRENTILITRLKELKTLSIPRWLHFE